MRQSVGVVARVGLRSFAVKLNTPSKSLNQLSTEEVQQEIFRSTLRTPEVRAQFVELFGTDDSHFDSHIFPLIYKNVTLEKAGTPPKYRTFGLNVDEAKLGEVMETAHDMYKDALDRSSVKINDAWLAEMAWERALTERFVLEKRAADKFKELVARQASNFSASDAAFQKTFTEALDAKAHVDLPAFVPYEKDWLDDAPAL